MSVNGLFLVGVGLFSCGLTEAHNLSPLHYCKEMCSLIILWCMTSSIHSVLSSQRNYSSLQVAEIACVTLRQVQWWDERKVVSPRHEGHRRVYNPKEVIEITVIAELRRKGFSLQKIRNVLTFITREMGDRIRDCANPKAEFNLLTDGKRVFLEESRASIIAILKTAPRAMCLVCINDQVKRL